MDSHIIDTIEQLCRELIHAPYIRPEELPDIDLYMDQVTTFMESRLSHSKRHPDDKILTKTMINNYAKNHVLPAPVKKKYSKEHLLILTFIYYLKNVISLSDIQTLLTPLCGRVGQTASADKDASSPSLEELYRKIIALETDRADALEASLLACLHDTSACFTDAPDEERDYLQLFLFISTLGYEVYLKQRLLERLIDNLAETQKTAESTAKQTKEQKHDKPEASEKAEKAAGKEKPGASD